MARVTAWSAVLALGFSGEVGAEAPEIRITSREAVDRALQHNLGLRVDRLDPALSDAACSPSAQVGHLGRLS